MRCRPSRRTTIMRRSSCSTRLAEPGRKGGRKPYGTPDEGMGASEPPRPPPPPRPPGPRPPRPPRPPPRPPDRPLEPLPDDISKLQYERAKVPPLCSRVTVAFFECGWFVFRSNPLFVRPSTAKRPARRQPPSVSAGDDGHHLVSAQSVKSCWKSSMGEWEGTPSSSQAALHVLQYLMLEGEVNELHTL